MASDARNCYVVTWELADAATRRRLVEELKSWGYFCPIHRNAWAVVTGKSASTIRDELRVLIETNDRLFVIRSGTEAAWRNSYGEKNDAWLKKWL